MCQNESQEGQIMSASPIDVETSGQADSVASGQRWASPGPTSDDLTANLTARMGTLEFGMGRMIGSIERIDSRLDDQAKLMGEMSRRLDGRIDEMGCRLDGKIDEMGRRLDGKIDEMGRRLDGKIDEMGRRLDGRIDEMGHRLDGRIDDLTRHMNGRFEHVDVQFGSIAAQLQKLTDVVSDLVSWKQRVWGICLAVSAFASAAGLLWALLKRIIPSA